jgi:hypothetical protein
MAACLFVLVGCVANHSSSARPSTPAPEASASEEQARSGAEFDVSNLSALQEVWWTWVASMPRDRSPVSDTTGEDCTQNQPEGVWLVAGSPGLPVTRRCSVPAGVPLAGPAVNFISGEPGDCEEFMVGATGEVTLDGDAVPVRAEDFDAVTFTAVEGNAVTNTAGDKVGYGCGLWFSVPGLESGAHLLEIRGRGKDVLTAVTYELTAVATP